MLACRGAYDDTLLALGGKIGDLTALFVAG
jgi:hypothetical protein